MYRIEKTTGFDRWLRSLKDTKAKQSISARIARIGQTGALAGDWKAVGDGVYELRFHCGPGYRVYIARHLLTLVILLHGGTKSTQRADIERAQRLWKEWRNEHGR